MPNEILQLKGAHALIRPNKPDNLPLAGIHRVMAEAKEESLEKLGLFDNGSPNYYTYYPDVTEADMNPSESEFIYPVYRLLSKVIIAPKRMAIDFTQGDILKKSMPLLVGQSIFIDHEDVTGSVMGVVQSVEWQEEYQMGNITVPAGINGVLKIDAKANPRIARAVMMDPPSIHSCSVTINFAWEKSHSGMSDEEFWNLLGTYDKNKQLIRKVVSDVNMYFELSLVPHGADPFAKKVKDGKLVMARQAAKIYQMSFSAKQLEREPYLGINGVGEASIYQAYTLNFSEKNLFNTNSIINNNNESDMNFKEFATALGYNPEDFEDEAALVAHIKDLGDKAEQFQTLTDENARLTGEVGTLTQVKTDLETEVETLKTTQADEVTLANAKVGEESLTATRVEATKFFKLLKGDKADATIIANIEKADFATAVAFEKSYREEYEAAVPLACEDCHSEKVSRKASMKGSGDKKDKTTTQLREEFNTREAKKATDSFLS